MKIVLYLVSLCACCALFSGCDYLKEKADGSDKKVVDTKTAAEIQLQQKLKESAQKHFPNNAILQAEWVNKQLGAHAEISRLIPDMPTSDYAVLVERAEAKYTSDYIERLRYLTTQIDAYKRIKLEQIKFDNSQWQIVSQTAEKNAPDNYQARLEIISDWKSAFATLNSRKGFFTQEEIDIFAQKLYTDYADKPREFIKYYEDCVDAKYQFNRYTVAGVERELQDELKAELLQDNGLSYQAKYAQLKDILKKAKDNPSLTLNALLNRKAVAKKQIKSEDSLRERAETIFRQSIFTMHGADNQIYTSALVKINGKVVVLSTKHFIPEKFPVVFSNSRGKIVCSKAYVSDSHPMILLIPDKEPTEFTPIEVVSKEDSLDLPNRELFMIAPARAGFMSVPVSVFSEDNEYLNFTSATNPYTSYSTSVRPIGRNATRLLVSITKTVDVGENAVVLDSKTGKLVSMAINVNNPGVISHWGKTGNVIGHENQSIPDYSTFVRQFDGAVNKTDAPRDSIKFVRITAFENWTPLNIEKFQKQKNEIRTFTDDNNDFLMFFKSNRFGEALRSRRLGRIAERYRKPLMHDNITRESFERNYRNYMIEVAYALKRDLMGNKDASEFYSIYRQEYKYQYKLREAMYKFISESLEDKNILNIIHTDLKTRYNNSSHNGARIGGSIGGGY